jgi:hypothetical protein
MNPVSNSNRQEAEQKQQQEPVSAKTVAVKD